MDPTIDKFIIQEEKPSPELDKVIQEGFQESYPSNSSTSSEAEEEGGEGGESSSSSHLCRRRIGPQIAFVIKQQKKKKSDNNNTANITTNEDEPSSSSDSNYNSNYIAAIIVKPFWGALHIKNLWVDQNFRNMGLATTLMRHAENYARLQKFSFCFVETFNFQALDFYQNEKIGYTLEFTRTGFADGVSYHYLKKEIIS